MIYTLAALKARMTTQKGFSLIELIIVIAIIGILIAIAIPVYGNIQHNARVKTVEQTASNFRAAVLAAQADDDPNTTVASVVDAMDDPTSKVRIGVSEAPGGEGMCGSIYWADFNANVPAIPVGDVNDCAV